MVHRAENFKDVLPVLGYFNDNYIFFMRTSLVYLKKGKQMLQNYIFL